ncbi:branched-chain amino acid ABC transporter permease [Maritimibacter sp. UBA3975]|uniref:branched-chain amino acid ABC transporter permease n=1 Tax=Maritimibacter sp. UBA3975 TaxID=1946833 RepID=UPI000C0A52B2|nr:branched-chain amino acid ABC transporter permease [Maritimibacter sp. UBA3975]MAM59944.1 branched-chain amino acid ABC transporter permease [Maritimibacter sp.]|tara:strand:- start:41123 stop:42001 length:879 start_codon:yes stop_codon:yes gene_type:complete
MASAASSLTFILLYGVSYGLVLFIISIGLVITMGLMRVMNLAHGAFAAIGGYIAVGVMTNFGIPFPLAVVAAVAGVVALSVVLERLVFVNLYGAPELDQVLMTIGINFIVIGGLTIFFGPNVYPINLPDYLTGNVDLGIRNFEIYRLFVIAMGLIVVVGLWIMFEKTSFGAKLRAAVDNPSMTRVIGINVNRVFIIAFGIGSGLAALGGAIGAGMLPLEPYYPMKYLVLVLVVVALSGFGNMRASLAVAVLVGIVDTAGRFLVPSLGGFIIYIVLVVLMVLRPEGLFTKRAA